AALRTSSARAGTSSRTRSARRCPTRRAASSAAARATGGGGGRSRGTPSPTSRCREPAPERSSSSTASSATRRLRRSSLTPCRCSSSARPGSSGSCCTPLSLCQPRSPFFGASERAHGWRLLLELHSVSCTPGWTSTGTSSRCRGRSSLRWEPTNPETWYQLGAFELRYLKRPRDAYRDLNESYTLDSYGPASLKGGPLDQARCKIDPATCP